MTPFAQPRLENIALNHDDKGWAVLALGIEANPSRNVDLVIPGQSRLMG